MNYDIVEQLRNGAYADLFMECARGEVDSCLRCDAAAEIERLRAFATSVADVVTKEHQPDLGYIEVDGQWRESIVCQRCNRSASPVQWPCAVLLVVDPEPAAVTEADLVTMRHMHHSRMCNCLGEASECCNPHCGCHEVQR